MNRINIEPPQTRIVSVEDPVASVVAYQGMNTRTQSGLEIPLWMANRGFYNDLNRVVSGLLNNESLTTVQRMELLNQFLSI